METAISSLPTLGAGAEPTTAPPSEEVKRFLVALEESGVESRLNPKIRYAISLLSQEEDRQLFAKGLYSIAGRLEQSERLEGAVFLYAYLSESEFNNSIPQELRTKSQQRLAVLRGEGSLGDQFAFNGSRAFAQGFDPAMVLGFTAGITLGATVSTRLFPRLLGNARFGIFAAPLGARLLSGTAGLVTEASTFWGVSKSIQEWRHPGSQSWDSQRSLEELAGLTLTFGVMKGFSALTEASLVRFRKWGLPPGAVFQPALAYRAGEFGVAQAGQLAGIMLGHELEIMAGLRYPQSFDVMLFDSASVLVSCGIGNGVSRFLFPKVHTYLNEMRSQYNLYEQVWRSRHAERFRERLKSWWNEGGGGPPWASIVLEGAVPASRSASEFKLNPILAWSLGSGGGSADIFPKGMKYSHGEYPGEAGLEGFFIEIGDAPMAKVFEALAEYQDFFEPGWRQKEVLEWDGVRFLLEPSFGKRFAEWVEADYEKLQGAYAGDISRLLSINQGVSEGTKLDAQGKDWLLAFKGRIDQDMVGFQSRFHLMSWIQKRLAHRSDWEKTTSILEIVAHDSRYLEHPFTELRFGVYGLLARPSLPMTGRILTGLTSWQGKGVYSTLRLAINSASIEAEHYFRTKDPLIKNAYSFLMGVYFPEGKTASVYRLRNILINLLTNAWRYRSNERPEITLNAEWLPDHSLELTVSDNGIGILPENLTKLGRHGFREERKEVSGSHGFGVNSVVSSLRSLGWGPLWVKSEVGKGSAFRFSVPAKEFRHPFMPLEVQASPELKKSAEEKNIREGFMVPDIAADLRL